ncbi:hypothetical protein [Rhodopseudomonas palustris]|uniref:Uncharacterized protein n=1 Tax=Rhodopseudomonas palustris TaxID=1076 RepID=A0A418V164_RHOPL|nr:hypothetical protein [Rhodopseudomonas palustris]RJF69590.1 hypothetical protein D4Q52_19740 [Rhodopseudomonas palustris]
MSASAGTIINELTVYDGRVPLGTILETDDGQHQAIKPDGHPFGVFRSRLDASRALSGRGKPPPVH